MAHIRYFASDFMVGDWVEVDNHFRQITSINRNGEIMFYDEKTSIEKISPVLLTDSILIESGFGCYKILNKDTYYYVWIIDGLQIEQLTEDMFYWACPGSNMTIKRIKYVHELQNIINLLRLNYEIDWRK